MHIAEVMLVFFALCLGFRLYERFLFLTLGSDLPPSTALGMEPGEKASLLEHPSPRDGPVVLGKLQLSLDMGNAALSVVFIVISLFHSCQLRRQGLPVGR